MNEAQKENPRKELWPIFKEYLKQKRGFLSVVINNIIPVIGYLFLDWNIDFILCFYWFEMIILLFSNLFYEIVLLKRSKRYESLTSMLFDQFENIFSYSFIFVLGFFRLLVYFSIRSDYQQDIGASTFLSANFGLIFLYSIPTIFIHFRNKFILLKNNSIVYYEQDRSTRLIMIILRVIGFSGLLIRIGEYPQFIVFFFIGEFLFDVGKDLADTEDKMKKGQKIEPIFDGVVVLPQTEIDGQSEKKLMIGENIPQVTSQL